MGFNPLTGIRSFLTFRYWIFDHGFRRGFNPLTGIRSFLTIDQNAAFDSGLKYVSIPSRGFVLF